MTPTAIHDDELTERRGDIHDLLEGLRELVVTARSMPLSNSVIVNRDEALEYLEDIVNRLPEEVRQARWLLKEREEFLERARREVDEIVAAARSRAEGMVQRTEVVRAAEARARQINEAAETDARRLRHETEDFLDQRLGSFEVLLDKLVKTVHAGRSKLAIGVHRGDDSGETEDPTKGFFDQDR